MQKVILDTNVIVSALISNSYPSLIVSALILTQQILTCLSDSIFEEYVEVLSRDKFQRFPNFKLNSQIILQKLKEISFSFHPIKSVSILKDSSDNKFLELASISAANYLITGNTLDFTFPIFENSNIVSPKEYWENSKPMLY